MHWFLPRDEIIDTYVVEKPASSLVKSENSNKETNGAVSSPSKKDNSMVITDMVSFYTLPSTVMSHPTHNKLKAAYSFYNVSTVTPWVDLIGDALVLAKKVIIVSTVYNWLKVIVSKSNVSITKSYIFFRLFRVTLMCSMHLI